MLGDWQQCKNILCIRPDNMGDLIMTGPALRALKESFGARITVFTSSMAAEVAGLMPEIDEVMVCDFPWVKTESKQDQGFIYQAIEQIKLRHFDAAVIFTVYSQNPLPAVMMAYLAGIPKRLAYCRENPYELLSHWVPDPEPYTMMRHQVRRDLELVACVGAFTFNDELYLSADNSLWPLIAGKLAQIGVNIDKQWVIIHAGVSEIKRRFNKTTWVETARELISEGYQVILTGSKSEKPLTDGLQEEIGVNSFSSGGLFTLPELIILISKAPVLVTVNTGTVHIAAAVKTPVVVLYALTNPQHTPWKVSCHVLPYQVAVAKHSKNEVIKYVNQFYYNEPLTDPDSAAIIKAVHDLLYEPGRYLDNELCLIKLMKEQAGLL